MEKYNFKNVENVEGFLNEIGLNVELRDVSFLKEGLAFLVNEFGEVDEFSNFDELNDYANERLQSLIVNDINVSELIDEYTAMNHYEIACCFQNQTPEMEEMYGEGGFSWYYKTRLLLSGKAVLKEALENTKDCSGYELFKEASMHFDYALMISEEDFISSCQ